MDLRRIRLVGNGAFHDLIGERELVAEQDLPPSQPLFIRFTPAAK